MSDLEWLTIPDQTPLGVPPSSDSGLLTVARVYAVDVANRLVQVGVRGDLAVWLPANPGRYQTLVVNSVPGLARVMRNTTTGRPELVAAPLNPRDPVVPGTMTASGGSTATVTVDGVSYVLPFLAGTYGTPPVSVWVSLSDWGVPVLIMGPSSVAPTGGSTPAPPASPATVQVSATIGPQWSGSYRYSRAAWDRWNTDRYGGRSTLYQGDGFGSGPMVGLATYGDQLVNLGAVSIDAVSVRLRSVGLSGASGPATVQGAPHATQPAGAPSPSGATASGDGWVALPAGICSGMQSGAVKGLCTVGANYWAVAGAGNGDGMVLQVTYTRPA